MGLWRRRPHARRRDGDARHAQGAEARGRRAFSLFHGAQLPYPSPAQVQVWLATSTCLPTMQVCNNACLHLLLQIQLEHRSLLLMAPTLVEKQAWVAGVNAIVLGLSE